MKQLLDADRGGGAGRTERTRYLGATAALALAAPAYAEYRKVALVEPLKAQLKLKKAKMEQALKAYEAAADYGIAEVATAATYQVAEMYRDFGRSLTASQRPAGLSGDVLDQYNAMLDEQAYPFEENAIRFHELNARRTASDIYDQWVRLSFTALAELNPVRYGKAERSQAPMPASTQAAVPAAAAAELEQAARLNPQQAGYFNQLGVAYRRMGQFRKAQEAYEHAVALDASHAEALLNLGILFDLYLWDSARALTHYERYLGLSPGGDDRVGKWVADIKNRVRRKDAESVSRGEAR
jgi:tetratricopeptide (TPR) repeat protein